MGNDGEIFKLDDGSFWQVKYEYEYMYEYYPAVVICPSRRTLIVGRTTLNVEPVGAVDASGLSWEEPNRTMCDRVTGGELRSASDDYFGVIASRYQSDSIFSRYGRYGNRYSSSSIWNRYGAGSRYRSESPWNRYSRGLLILKNERNVGRLTVNSAVANGFHPLTVAKCFGISDLEDPN